MDPHQPVSDDHFSLNLTLPGKKEMQLVMNSEKISFGQDTFMYHDVSAIRFGIQDKSSGLINLGKRYAIDLKTENGSEIKIKFSAKKPDEVNRCDNDYSRILDSLWFAVTDDLVYYMYDDFLDNESFRVGDLEIDEKGVNYQHPKDFFFIPWQELKFTDHQTYLHLESETLNHHQLDLSYRTVWNAFVFKCMLERAKEDNAFPVFE